MNKYPAKFCLFAASIDENEEWTNKMIEEAKVYIKKNGLTSDDVRILKSDTDVTVWTKRDGVELKCAT